MRLLVDGMNVIGSRPDGWWRDRPGARRRLVEELASWAGTRDGVMLTVVFDGRPNGDEVEAGEACGVDVRFAPGGPNAADGAIVELVAAADDPGTLTVVTSDGALADAVRAAGAMVEGASAFLRRMMG